MQYDVETLPFLTCLRCGSSWRQRREQPPKKCPKCQNPNWKRPPHTPLLDLQPSSMGIDVLADHRLLVTPVTLEEMRENAIAALSTTSLIADQAIKFQTQIRHAQNYLNTGLTMIEQILAARTKAREQILPKDQPPLGPDIKRLQGLLDQAEQAHVHDVVTDAPKPAAKPKRPRVHKSERKAKHKK